MPRGSRIMYQKILSIKWIKWIQDSRGLWEKNKQDTHMLCKISQPNGLQCRKQSVSTKSWIQCLYKIMSPWVVVIAHIKRTTTKSQLLYIHIHSWYLQNPWSHPQISRICTQCIYLARIKHATESVVNETPTDLSLQNGGVDLLQIYNTHLN